MITERLKPLYDVKLIATGHHTDISAWCYSGVKDWKAEGCK